jgi:uncharacterized protein DUF4062
VALLIDTSSAARQLSEQELRQWADGRAAFISSVMDELATERRAVADGLGELGMRPILFEDLGGRDDSAEQAYLAGVAQSELYIGLIGDRYGTMLPTGRSPTHEEYRKAQDLGRRISVWSREPSEDRQGNARDFLDEIQVFHTTGRFSHADDLVAGIRRRLGEIAADDEAPWVKLGDAIFRVDRIRDEGERVLLSASVRESSLARYLEGLRPDKWGAGNDVQLTTSDRSGKASVKSVMSEIRSKSVRSLEIEAQVNWADGGGNSMAAGTSNYSADDLAEIGLQSGLLGTPLPPELRSDMLGSLVDRTDPLQELAQLALPEDSLVAVARLAIVEQLVGGRQASYVDAFELGPEHRGSRRLRLAYTDPRRYSNQDLDTRSFEGARPWN